MQVNMNKSINKLIIGQQIDFTPTADNLGLNHNVFPESLGVFESRSARRHLTAATNAALSKVPSRLSWRIYIFIAAKLGLTGTVALASVDCFEE